MRTTPIALLTLLSMVGHVSAAEIVRCGDDETVNDCVDRLVVRHISELRNEKPLTSAIESVAAGETADNQAGSTSGGAQAKSTVTDLLPWLNMLGMVSDSDSSDGTVALDLNFLLGHRETELDDHNSQLKLAIDVSPEPFPVLIEAIPEAAKEARTKELSEKVKDTGDSELQFTHSIVNQKWGRDFGQHERTIARIVTAGVESAIPDEQTVKRREARAAFERALGRWLEEHSASREALLNSPGVTPVMRDELNQIILDARNGWAAEKARQLDAAQKRINQSDLTLLADLVLQQPQFLISANRRFRQKLVGPNSWGAKITYEQSFASLSGLLKEARNCREFATRDLNAAGNPMLPTGKEAMGCLSELAEYRENHAEDLESESRWKLGVEYKVVDDWRYALALDEVDLDLPSHDRLIASAGYGRAVSGSAVKDRIDFEAAYDSNLDDDRTYKSRFVVTLTYTRRFMEMDIPISLVYANKSEFLGDVDKQIGLHFGIKYRALNDKK